MAVEVGNNPFGAAIAAATERHHDVAGEATARLEQLLRRVTETVSQLTTENAALQARIEAQESNHQREIQALRAETAAHIAVLEQKVRQLSVVPPPPPPKTVQQIADEQYASQQLQQQANQILALKWLREMRI